MITTQSSLQCHLRTQDLPGVRDHHLVLVHVGNLGIVDSNRVLELRKLHVCSLRQTFDSFTHGRRILHKLDEATY